MADPVLLITGASSGIGAATARHAAANGYRVALAARSADKLDALVAELGADSALALECDVTDKASQQAMVEHTLERFGRIDAVFANAGIGGRPGGFCGADSDVWKDMILTNIYGVGLTIQACADALKESRGHLLITGSAAGRTTIPGSMYSATKWAVSAIGYGVREELRGTGIRVTLIEPGMVDTPFFDEQPDHALTDQDIAEAVLFSLSRPASVDVNEILVRPTPQIDN
ncbi:short-chain dehydrogenase/reductase SDR [Salinisphaera shabanensis T35B1]|jgi:NADP-dependent 3-hydroxy acid dehydrogenase YdfG|uniref:1-deoxy-D-xylulose-5-phosphate reductoisomerase protein n=1 Tax=Salinisphaera shabanensis E1L3A TaxID=1033802 RepID=U2EN97_9GAMM|nr:SDR family oxidoreductase [Salinisphaera shabanensis]ERJ19335.1 1-deoxy-D-xylulose-5-phosphate reductoisomerase protein [Salinisphaera shabanensis E1L3A]